MFYSEVFLLHIDPAPFSGDALARQRRNVHALAADLPHQLPRYGIETDQRQAHFLDQIYVESARFSTTEENLRYNRKRFHQVFPPLARDYDRWERVERRRAKPDAAIDRPRLAGDTAYSKRMGNGPYESDEGYRYRGRGFMQVTGKTNYAAVGALIGVDLVHNPDLLAEPTYALMSACCFWQRNRLNALADRNDIRGVTMAINGGLQGLAERKKYTFRIIEMQRSWSGATTEL